jgi:nucleoside-diphosphate-sugar epimerase
LKVLLTGSQGYLGTVLAQRLLADGHQVVGLDSGLFADCILGEPPVDPPTLRMDIRDVAAADLHGFDAVAHLAAISNDPLGFLSPQTTYQVNHLASVRLARVAKAAGVRRFLYASTCSVYGAASRQDVLDEDARLAPVTPYAVSKVRVEADLHDLADPNFSPVYLRNATAFGFSPRLRGDIVLNDLVASAVLTGVIMVRSDGTPWRPLVHVRDIAEVFSRVLVAPPAEVHDEAFNVGAAVNNLQVADIAEVVRQVVPGSRVAIVGEPSPDERSYRVNFDKLQTRLPGLPPSWTAEQGAAELYDAYRRYGLADFGRRFVRLTRLLELQAAGQVDSQMRATRAEFPVLPNSSAAANSLQAREIPEQGG